ncbi:MAG: biopolymer transporter ExbD [Phycisphaeraceae bacterium]|nr:biopolymer transporter ExbD [Phycisphaeraceae bacterium]
MRFHRESEDDSPAVQMTPMIDCVFLLLIFFIVTASIEPPSPQLDLDLPVIELAEPAPRIPGQVHISIDSQGQFHLDSGPVNRQQLRQFLEVLSRDDPAPRIRLNIDQQAPSRYFLEVTNMLTIHGLRQVSFGGK